VKLARGTRPACDDAAFRRRLPWCARARAAFSAATSPKNGVRPGAGTDVLRDAIARIEDRARGVDRCLTNFFTQSGAAGRRRPHFRGMMAQNLLTLGVIGARAIWSRPPAAFPHDDIRRI